jgi:hypothetical protein
MDPEMECRDALRINPKEDTSQLKQQGQKRQKQAPRHDGLARSSAHVQRVHTLAVTDAVLASAQQR